MLTQLISGRHSPREILTCRKMYFTNHCKEFFGWYVEENDDTTITNDASPRTHAFNVLIPNKNIQVTQKFLKFTLYNSSIEVKYYPRLFQIKL